MKDETIKQIAWKAWQGAANAFRMYPNNSHTFNGYWNGAESQFDEFKEQPHPEAKGEGENIVKEIRVGELLHGMMKSDLELYERIMDTPGFAYYFNELAKLAMK